MSSMINTNIASLSAQRNLSKSQDSLNTALQRLSSGLRINSAKDDAAGLAISTRMTSQINGMNQAIRNANDGISLAQTADSSLDEVTNNLQRIRDLALQAANGTNSADDRSALDVEVQQRLAEVNRIASQTTFNGINLLDGSFSSQAFQIGANANQTVTISSISSAKVSDLGLGAGTVAGTALASTVATTGITAGSLSLNGTTVTTDATTNSAKALAAAINGNTTITASGVTAVATNKVSAAFTTVSVTKAAEQGTALGSTVPSVAGTAVSAANGVAANSLSINGSVITTSSSTNSAKLLAAAVNAQASVTGVNATAQATSTTAADSAAFQGGSVTMKASSGVQYTLSVGGVNIYSATQTGASAGTITAALVDGNATAATGVTSAGGLGSATVQAALTAAGITVSGSAVAGTLAFQKADGSNIAISETTTGGAGSNFSGTSFVTGGATAHLAQLNLGSGSAVNTVTDTSSVKLTSTSAISVSGSSAANSGLVNGTYGGMANQASKVGNVVTGTTVTTGTGLVINGTGITTSVATLPNTTTLADSTKFANGSVVMAVSAKNTYALSVGGVDIFSGVHDGTANTVTLTAANVDGTATDAHFTTTAGGLNSASVQTALKAAGISFTGTAAAGTLQFQKADGTAIAITETTTAGTGSGATDFAGSVSFVTGGTAGNLNTFTDDNTLTDAAVAVTTGLADAQAFKNGSVTGLVNTNTYSLSVGGITVYAGNATGAAGNIVAASIDGTAVANFTVTTTLASATAGALATAGISVTGTAAAGNLQFRDSNGHSLSVVESITSAVAAGTSMVAGGGTVSGTNFTATAAHLAQTDAKTLAANINASSQTTGVNATLNGTFTTSADSAAFKAGSLSLVASGSSQYALTVGNGKGTVTLLSVTQSGGTAATFAAADLDGNNLANANAAGGADVGGLGSTSVQAALAAAGITYTGTAAGGDLQFQSADGSALRFTETISAPSAGTNALGTSFLGGAVAGSGTLAKSNEIVRESAISLNSANAIVVSGTDTGTNTGIANGTYSPSTASALTINGTAITTGATTVGADKVAAAINLQTATTGVTATALATTTGALGSFTATSTAGYGLSVNGVKVVDTATSAIGVNAKTIDDALATTGTGSVGANLAAAGITTTGSAQAGTLQFLSASGADLHVVETQGGTDTAGFGKKAATTASQFSSTVTLSSASAFTVGGTGSAKAGLAASTNNIVNQQGSKLSTTVASSGITLGSLTVNGTTIVTGSGTTSAQLLAQAINTQQGTTGVTATAQTTQTSATLFGGQGTPKFQNVVTQASSSYALNVGGVTIASQGASVAAGSGVTAAQIDSNLAASGTNSIASQLATQGITFTGSAVQGNLQFSNASGANIGVAEIVTGTVTGGVSKGAGVTNTGGTLETATSSVSLSGAGNITVGGSSSSTAGFTSGTVGTNKQYTLTVGDGTTSVDLSLDLSKGAFGTSIKSTDIASAVNSSAALQALKISAAIDANGKIELTASDARNITLKEASSDTVTFGVSGTSGFSDTDAGAATAGGVPAAAVTHMGQISLTGTKDLTVAGTAPTTTGLTAGAFGGANVKSVDAANATLTAIDAALKTISTSRASLGAYQNRFASTVANLTANSESLTSARSRILDADFASETAQLTRGQILQQAGTAMLAQANQLPNGVLSLLRG